MTGSPTGLLRDPTDARRRVTVLHPGDVAGGESGYRLETLLGSCVAIVLSDPRRTFGAMCHIVHAKAPATTVARSGAYAAIALETLYALLLGRGLDPLRCDAWVFGGGNMFPGLIRQGHVGDDNVRWVLDALGADGIAVRACDVGGNVYRRVAWTVGADEPRAVAVPV